MKKSFLSVVAILSITGSQAQAVLDTVTTGPAYANNIWYSLENDDQGVQPATNWDLALATTVSPSSPLVTSILFNSKIGAIYEIPSSDPSDLSAADTTGLSTWTPLYNSEVAWGTGALNNTTNLGTWDYGWGNYDNVTHTGIVANRVFALTYTNGTCKIFTIGMTFADMSYHIEYSDADHTNAGTQDIAVTSYASKNFVYYGFSGGIVDREPASSSWDLVFHQYTSFVPTAYTVAGVFSNVGVTVAQVEGVDQVTYEDYAAGNYSDEINTIGYDWKAYAGSWTLESDWVYFVNTANGDYWKLVFTGFGGSGTGKYMLSKEKISGAGVIENEGSTSFVTYPNPTLNGKANMVFNTADVQNASIAVYSLSGELISTTEVSTQSGLNVVPVTTSELNSGVYVITLIVNGVASQQRLIVQ